MVHPSELLRTNSNEGRQFSAPANILQENPIDCGISALPCINKCVNLEKFAKPKTFLIIYSLLGLLQGIMLIYFRGTSFIWQKHYNIPSNIIDWIIYINDIFVGLFALIITYWGNKIHRISWIGGIAIYHSLVSLLFIIIEIHRKPSTNNDNTTLIHEDINLCIVKKQSSVVQQGDNLDIVGFSVIILYQIIYSMFSVTFISLGITYIDDNVSTKITPIYIGIALAVRELGKQIGIYSSWIPSFFQHQMVFVSIIWIPLCIFLFIIASLLCCFPRALPSALIPRMAASILDLASGINISESIILEKKKSTKFLPTLFRLLKNKILLISIFSMVFIQTALINFSNYEKYFYQSKYFLSIKEDTSGYIDPPLIQFTTNLLKYPLKAVFLLVMGFIISKIKPKGKILVVWNIIVLCIVMIIFASTVFLNCEENLEIDYTKIITKPYCSSHCNCDYDFQPICLKDKTYYSPCLAGCTTYKDTNSNYRIYRNCTCDDREWYSKHNNEASDGACNIKKCNLLYGLMQVNKIISSAIFSTTLITNLIIHMRCVASGDKAMALGLEATLIGIIPYIIVKSIIESVSSRFCRYYTDTCKLYSDKFSIFLSLITLVFMFISICFSSILFYMIGDLDIFNIINQHPDIRDVNLNRESIRTIRDEQNKNDNHPDNRNSSYYNLRDSLATSSLIEMENFSDDRDSVDSRRLAHRQLETEF